MRLIISILVLLLLSLFLTKTYAQQKAVPNLSAAIKNKKIVSILTKNLSSFPENTEVSIALINGETTRYIGIIRKNDTLEVITNKNSVFEIGSITKVFTSILFASFIDKNKNILQENLQQHFDFTLKSGGNITLQQLANHSSGLPRLPKNIFPLLAKNPNNPYKEYTPKMLQNYLKNEVELDYKTGSKSIYSNLGAGLLGNILTKKAQKTYENLLQETIFIPLKMTNSTTSLKNINQQKLVKGRNADGKETSNWEFTDTLIGAGGIKSTTADMEKFVKKNFGENPIYVLPQTATYTVNKTYKMGLGWHLLNTDTILFHNGGTGGYRSSLAIKKETKKGVIILSNVSAFHKNANTIDTLCFQLLKTL